MNAVCTRHAFSIGWILYALNASFARCRYLPGEIFYSIFGYFYQTVAFITILTSLLWFTVNTLCGVYAIIPWVSEACLMQVAAMEQNSGN